MSGPIPTACTSPDLCRRTGNCQHWVQHLEGCSVAAQRKARDDKALREVEDLLPASAVALSYATPYLDAATDRQLLIEALRADIAELRKDKKRLDWLMRSVNCKALRAIGVICEAGGETWTRRAVDAAMEKEKA